MKLIITQPEIEAIVRAHVESTVQLREGADMKIDFTATRSDDGIVATIDIPYMGVSGFPAIAAAAAAPTPAPAPTHSITGKSKAAARKVEASPATAVLQAVAEATEATPAQDVPSAPEPAAEETSPLPDTDTAGAAETTTTEPAAPSRSLFGNSSFLAR